MAVPRTLLAGLGVTRRTRDCDQHRALYFGRVLDSVFGAGTLGAAALAAGDYSWSRLLSGQFRDPLVGRDILFGVMLGMTWILISRSAPSP